MMFMNLIKLEKIFIKNIIFSGLEIKDLNKRDIDIFDEDKGFSISSIVLKDDAIFDPIRLYSCNYS